MGHWISLCVKCCRMVDSVPRWQLSLSWSIHSNHLLITDWMIPPLRQERSHSKNQYIPGKQVLELWKNKKTIITKYYSSSNIFMLRPPIVVSFLLLLCMMIRRGPIFIVLSTNTTIVGPSPNLPFTIFTEIICFQDRILCATYL